MAVQADKTNTRETNKAKVAVVAPIKFLDKYCITDFQVCYASLYLDSEVYRRFYTRRAIAGDIIILDNPKTLSKREANAHLLPKIVKELNPDCVVLPSTDFSSEKTIAQTRNFLRFLNKADVKTVGSLQGHCLKDLKRCYKSIRKSVDIIGLSSLVERMEKRDALIEMFDIQEPVVYLDTYSKPYEELPCHSNVIGMTTDMPLRLAYESRTLREHHPTPKSLNFDLEIEPLPELAEYNVREFLGLF